MIWLLDMRVHGGQKKLVPIPNLLESRPLERSKAAARPPAHVESSRTSISPSLPEIRSTFRSTCKENNLTPVYQYLTNIRGHNLITITRQALIVTGFRTRRPRPWLARQKRTIKLQDYICMSSWDREERIELQCSITLQCERNSLQEVDCLS